ncbi:MAG: hypothetical protein IPN36_12590 [Bacteroidetes bacterium]|nr:hypothetical protein [Bacteroidota bacterium]
MNRRFPVYNNFIGRDSMGQPINDDSCSIKEITNKEVSKSIFNMKGELNGFEVTANGAVCPSIV